MHDVMMGEMFDEYEMECVNYFRYTKKVEKIRKVRNRNRIRNRMYAVMEMDLMSEEEFRVQYRMRRDIFNCLLQKILPNISLSERGVINGNNSSGSIIQPKIKLAVTLRYLAGASHLDLSFGYGVSKSGLFNQTNGIIWKTMEAINNVLEISFPVDDVSKMNDIEIGFRKYSLHRIRGCVILCDIKMTPYNKSIKQCCVTTTEVKKFALQVFCVVITTSLKICISFTKFCFNMSHFSFDDVSSSKWSITITWIEGAT